MKKFATALALSALVTGAAIAGPQGVTDDKITLGSYTDLSGPYLKPTDCACAWTRSTPRAAFTVASLRS